MKSLLSIEWRKYSLTKKNIVLFLLSAFLIYIFVFSNYSLAQQDRSRISENYKERAQSLQEEDLPNLNLLLKRDKNTIADEKHLQKLIDLFEKQNVIFENAAAALDENDSEKILKYELEDVNMAIYSHESRLLYGHRIGELREEAVFSQYLYDNQIYVPDSFFQTGGLYMLYFFVINVFPILLPAIALFAAFSSISNEKSQGTLKFLLQQPYSRRKILLSKLSVSSMRAFLILGIICLFQFAIASFVGGIGYSQYPVEASGALPNAFLIGNETYIPLSVFLIYALGITCIGIIFYAVLATFISVVSPNTITSFCLVSPCFIRRYDPKQR